MEDNDDYKVTMFFSDNTNVVLLLDENKAKEVEDRYIACRNLGQLMDIKGFISNDVGCIVNLIDPQHIEQFTIERYYGDEDE